MIQLTDLNAHVVESLYSDALVLADDIRDAFRTDGKVVGGETGEDLDRIALSCEGLRTTTRMMHALAWLLNRRSFFSGDTSEFQLRRNGSLPSNNPSDPDNLFRLDPYVRSLVERSERFHARIARLDRAWREQFVMNPPAILRLQNRLNERFTEEAEPKQALA